MKKSISTGLLVLILVLAISCAGSKPESTSAQGSDVKSRRDLPEWFMNPPVSSDVIYGLGMAKLSSDSLSRDTAIARARKDIAVQVSSRVQTAMTDYAQQAGTEENNQTIAFVESITKQVANVNLRNTITEKVYPAEDGSWFAMVSYPKSQAEEEVAAIFKRNEDAAFAEFKANEALRMLEDSINSKPLKSAATTD